MIMLGRSLQETSHKHSMLSPIASMLSALLAIVVLVHPAKAIQPEARSAVAAPLRHLPWGQLNFLHTTDVHGWFGGHLQEYVLVSLFCVRSRLELFVELSNEGRGQTDSEDVKQS